MLKKLQLSNFKEIIDGFTKTNKSKKFHILTKFEKTGSISKFFILQGNMKIKIHSKLEIVLFFANFNLLLFDSGVCLTFNKSITLNIKKSKVEPQKSTPESEKTLRIFLKKNYHAI